VIRDVGVHLKGSAGSFRQLGDKPAFTIKFDHFVPGQKYRGLQKLSLNNAVQDPTYLSDLLGNELFRAAGVPAPRIGHARLELNGKAQGFYVVLEAITRDFLRRSFGDPTGNLYKGSGDVDGDIFVDPRSPSKDRADLKALTVAAAEPDRNKRRERMAAVLDLDRFASFLALETMHWHWDGYSMAQNNFDIYHDPVSDRLVFFPHDQDQLFGEPGGPIYPPLSGLVARAFRSTPWGGKLYRERLAALRGKLLDPDTVARRLEKLATKINPVITEIDAEQGKAHREAAAGFIKRIRERSESIREQLDRPEPEPPKALAFEGRTARTFGWESRTTLGQPRFARSNRGGHEGGGALRISAPEKDQWCGSFRTSVILPPGRYRFGGLMKTKGVEPLEEGVDRTHAPSGGALRISGTQPSRKLLGDQDWTWVEFDFEVKPTEGEGDSAVGRAELVCELRASRGTVWFDEGSLEVIRVDVDAKE
jgi:spore coat protein H